MKTMVLAVAAFFATMAIAPNMATAQDKLNPGDKIPGAETVLQNANGNSTTLKGAQGENGLLVIFSCNTCPFVIKNQPVTMKTLAYAKEHHIGVVIVNSNEAQRDDADSYEAMKKYAKEQGYNVPYVVDQKSELADMFGASHTPEIYLFNKAGKLAYKGAMNDNPGDPSSFKKMYIFDAIDAVVAGKQANPSTTKSVGCGIKRKSA